MDNHINGRYYNHLFLKKKNHVLEVMIPVHADLK